MSTFIITTRNPSTRKLVVVGAIENDVLDIIEFETEAAARQCADGTRFVKRGVIT